MPAAATAKEKVQFYLRKDQVDRLHAIKGQTRKPISGQMESALDDYFARLDRKRRTAGPESN